MQKPLRYIRRRDLVTKIGLSATTIYNLERSGDFPKHVLLTPRCAAWAEDEVDAWLEARKAAQIPPAPVPERRTRTVRFGRTERGVTE